MSPASIRAFGLTKVRIAGLASCGQPDAEGGAVAFLRLDLDDAAEPGDDAVHGGETEAGPGWLRGEEAAEDPRLDIRAHADSGVGHGEFHVPPWPGTRMLAREIGTDVGWPGTDCQRAAIRHRIASVEGQVEQYLFKLTTISEHGRQIRRPGFEYHFGAAGQADLDQVADTDNQRIEINRLGSGPRAAAEADQVA